MTHDPRYHASTIEGDELNPSPYDYMAVHAHLRHGEFPIGYDKEKPNHGWRVLDGGQAGNVWARVCHRHELAELFSPDLVAQSYEV